MSQLKGDSTRDGFRCDLEVCTKALGLIDFSLSGLQIGMCEGGL